MTLTTLVPVTKTGGNFASIPPDSVQLSVFEPTKTGSGTITTIPTTSGRVVSVSLRSTIWNENFAGSDSCAVGVNGSAVGGSHPAPLAPTLFADGPFTGGAFADISTINAMTYYILVTYNGHDGDPFHIDSLFYDVTWSPTPGFATMMMLGLVGAISLLSPAEMPALSRHMYARTRTAIQRHEYASAWREIRAYRWPHHVDLGRIR